MPGLVRLVPAIHVFASPEEEEKTWRRKPDHDKAVGSLRMAVHPKFTLAERREPG